MHCQLITQNPIPTTHNPNVTPDHPTGPLTQGKNVSDRDESMVLRVVRDTFAGTGEHVADVFIAYYPDDSRHAAESIQAWFALRYGSANVVTSAGMPPFLGSAEYYIREKLRTCHFLVAIIGPAWVQTLAERRAEGERDTVRLAIRLALEEGRPVVPVCMDGVELPRVIDLPHDLRPMLNFPAVRLGEGRSFADQIAWVFEQVGTGDDPLDADLPLAEFETQYAQFRAAYDAGDWSAALGHLAAIQALGQVPRPFRLQLEQYTRQIQTHLRLEEARPVYADLVALARTDPGRAWTALHAFLAEYPEHGDPQQLAERLRPAPAPAPGLVQTATDPAQPPLKRIQAARKLAEHGDPRYGTGLRADGVPEIDWVRIPAGRFIFHYDRRMELPTFYIARYPITHAQFTAFIAAGGYDDPRWWEGLARRETRPDEQRWPWDNQPRERVSWFDAVAFCRWLSVQLGHAIRLPTEPEWEKAARGTGGRIYPWGDRYIGGCANINEVTSGVGTHNLRQPTPVGIYPQGASEFGVLDMVGNVWEWCLNPEGHPDRYDLGTDARRALRGGSWLSEWMFAHTVRRRVQTPDSRFPDFGFRVVCNSLPVLAGRRG